MSIFDHPIGVRLIVASVGFVHVTIVIVWAGYETGKDSHEKPIYERVDCNKQSYPTLDTAQRHKVLRTIDETYTRTTLESNIPRVAEVREGSGSIPSNGYLDPPPPLIKY